MKVFPALVSATSAKLTAADHNIARVLLDDPDVAMMLTAQKVAERANVHEAAATRFAQKLGFKGYPQLREVLRRDALSTRDAASRLENSVSRMRDRGYFVSLVEDEIAALRAAMSAVPAPLIDEAAAKLWRARRIFLFARGHASALAMLAERRLRRFGKATIRLQGEPRDVAEAIHSCQGSELVFAFAFRRKPRLLDPVLQTAHEQEANSILICDPLIAAFSPASDITLAAPRGRSDHEFQTLTVPMAILNAIILSMGAAPQADQALDDVQALIERLETE